MRNHHLAEANIAWIRYALDDPRMSEFVEALARVNALAEGAPGFVWRFQTDSGNATSVRVLDDPNVLFNMSVWESMETLRSYTYRHLHGEFFRRRGEWFRRAERPSLVLWWVTAGETPTVEQALERFERLWAVGPSEEAFTFQRPFPAPGESLDK